MPPCSRFTSPLAAALLVGLAGCGGTPTSPSMPPPPHTTMPSPDAQVTAIHFPYRSIDVGGGEWSRRVQRSSQMVGGTDFIAMGQKRAPQVDLVYAGRFPALGAQITINGQPWWSTVASCESQEGYAGSTTLNAPSWTPPDTGTYVFAVSLDPENQYAEVNETNNAATLVVRASFGNLTANRIELDRVVSGTLVLADTVSVGTPVQVIVMSSCWGEFPAYRMRLEQNGAALIDTTTSCASDILYGFNNPQLVWIASDPGVHVFTLTLDPDHEIKESSMGDNVVTASLVVVP